MSDIKWTTEKRKLSELVPDRNNPRTLSAHDHRQLKKSLKKFNLASVPVVDSSNNILAGHQRIAILTQEYGRDYEIDVRVPSRELSEDEVTEYRLRDNRNHGDFDYDILANTFDVEYLESVGFKGSELVGFETDDFDEEFYSYDDENAVMPIVPKWNEKYSAVIILSDNLMDDNFLKNFFKVESAVDYKTSRVAPNFVITAKKFIEYLRNYNE